MEKVDIYHPKTEGAATVSRRSYELVWKDRGWRLARTKKETPDKEKEE